jgi:hypothetical protein
MSTITPRRAAAAAAVLAALSTTGILAFGQAQAHTVYACVQGSGNAHLFSRRTKCKSGESKLSWGSRGEQGLEGLPGPLGLVGPAGAAGATGAKGATGAAGAVAAKGSTGVTGATGPSGTSTVQRVVGTEVKVTGAVGSLSGEATATCTEGTLVGGGASTEFSGEYEGSISDSYPSSSTTWGAKAIVSATGASGELGVTAYALCAS